MELYGKRGALCVHPKVGDIYILRVEGDPFLKRPVFSYVIRSLTKPPPHSPSYVFLLLLLLRQKFHFCFYSYRPLVKLLLVLRLPIGNHIVSGSLNEFSECTIYTSCFVLSDGNTQTRGQNNRLELLVTLNVDPLPYLAVSEC